MGGANGADLLDVMAAVNQVKPAPLVDAERPENHVRDAAARAKQGFRLVEEVVYTGQMFACVVDEIATANWRGRLRGSDLFRGLATSGEDAQGGQRILADALLEGGLGAGGGAFGQTSVECGLSESIGETEVLDDLLDAPLFVRYGEGQLGLGGVEAFDRTGDFVLELLKDGIHGRSTTLHRFGSEMRFVPKRILLELG